MKNDRILHAMGKISDELIEDAAITTNKKTNRKMWVRWVAIAACLCLLVAASLAIAPHLGGDAPPTGNPLVISVYAKSEDGTIIPTALNVGEKVKMHPASSTQLEDFDGYAINLTVFDDQYVYLRCVDKNWNTLRFPTNEIYPDTKIEFNWAATEGDDIWVIHLDLDGKVIPPGVDELMSPKRKGSDFIWRPNDKDMNRAIIGVFDEAYELLVVYYLEITEENGDYYAEVVKIDDEIPPSLE